MKMIYEFKTLSLALRENLDGETDRI